MEDTYLEIVRESLVVAIEVSAPVLLAGIAVGLIISIFQSVTQVQEQTLSMVPKIVVMTAVAVLLLPWMATRLAEFAREMFRLF